LKKQKKRRKKVKQEKKRKKVKKNLNPLDTFLHAMNAPLHVREKNATNWDFASLGDISRLVILGNALNVLKIQAVKDLMMIRKLVKVHAGIG